MDQKSKLTVIVLAAGKGTRMKSDKAKVLHEVFSSPMVHHVLNAIAPLNPEQTITIIGHQREKVLAALKSFSTITVTQEEQLGTGHAVLVAESAVSTASDSVMILCGDTPLIRPETLQEMYEVHLSTNSTLTLMTTVLDNPTNYGRIITDSNGQVKGIVEQKDATPEQLKICEINAGIYCVEKSFLFESLKKVGTDNSQGEVYLTDIVEMAVTSDEKVEKYSTPFSQDVLGVNSRVELSQAHTELMIRRNTEIMLEGVTIQSPNSVCISPDSTIGRDCLLMSGVHIQGYTVIGENCILNPGVIVTDCKIGNNVKIGAYSVLYGQEIPDNSIISPYSTQAD